MMLYVSEFHVFLRLNNNPLYVHTYHILFIIYLLMDI